MTVFNKDMHGLRRWYTIYFTVFAILYCHYSEKIEVIKNDPSAKSYLSLLELGMVLNRLDKNCKGRRCYIYNIGCRVFP